MKILYFFTLFISFNLLAVHIKGQVTEKYDYENFGLIHQNLDQLSLLAKSLKVLENIQDGQLIEIYDNTLAISSGSTQGVGSILQSASRSFNNLFSHSRASREDSAQFALDITSDITACIMSITSIFGEFSTSNENKELFWSFHSKTIHELSKKLSNISLGWKKLANTYQKKLVDDKKNKEIINTLNKTSDKFNNFADFLQNILESCQPIYLKNIVHNFNKLAESMAVLDVIEDSKLIEIYNNQLTISYGSTDGLSRVVQGVSRNFNDYFCITEANRKATANFAITSKLQSEEYMKTLNYFLSKGSFSQDDLNYIKTQKLKELATKFLNISKGWFKLANTYENKLEDKHDHIIKILKDAGLCFRVLSNNLLYINNLSSLYIDIYLSKTNNNMQHFSTISNQEISTILNKQVDKNKITEIYNNKHHIKILNDTLTRLGSCLYIWDNKDIIKPKNTHESADASKMISTQAIQIFYNYLKDKLENKQILLDDKKLSLLVQNLISLASIESATYSGKLADQIHANDLNLFLKSSQKYAVFNFDISHDSGNKINLTGFFPAQILSTDADADNFSNAHNFLVIQQKITFDLNKLNSFDFNSDEINQEWIEGRIEFSSLYKSEEEALKAFVSENLFDNF
ncbi:MAG: hypothetical protein H6731_11025 [Myxococcales bacterium]|nr:MAG: hypothetical protein H6731_11025 [Myxococcales bacterium]